MASEPSTPGSCRKRKIKELIDESSETSLDTDSAFSTPSPTKKRKRSKTPILTPLSDQDKAHSHCGSKSKQTHHDHRHDKPAIIRCLSGHGLVPSNSNDPIDCKECGRRIEPNEQYYQCPRSVNKGNDGPYAICTHCWDKERQQYTGAITLGQRVRMKIGPHWRLGSILKHWPDDGL